MLAIFLTIACSRYKYNGVILHAHPVRGESHNQRNTTGEVATIVMLWYACYYLIHFVMPAIQQFHATLHPELQSTNKNELGCFSQGLVSWGLPSRIFSLCGEGITLLILLSLYSNCRPRYKHIPMSYGDREFEINHIL